MWSVRAHIYIAVETGANYWEGAAHGTNRVSRAERARPVGVGEYKKWAGQRPGRRLHGLIAFDTCFSVAGIV